jgi:hypothetical protein
MKDECTRKDGGGRNPVGAEDSPGVGGYGRSPRRWVSSFM